MAWARKRGKTWTGGYDAEEHRARGSGDSLGYLAGRTNVPRPCRVMITPWSRRTSIARRTVV